MNDLIRKLFQRRRDAEGAAEHPGIVVAFETLRDRAIADFVTSTPHQIKEREDAYQRLRALALVRQELQQAVEDHEFAVAIEERKEAATAR